jgi:hypothetical protein
MPFGIGKVDLTIATGAVAQASVATGRGPLTIVGPCTGGVVNTPTLLSNRSTLLQQFIGGPTVEAAAYALTYEVPSVVLVRTDDTGGTPGAYGSITEVETVTVSADEDVLPADDLEPVVEFRTGGTVGSNGITYRYSLDGGRQFSGVLALGTSSSITLPYGGGKYNLSSTVGAGAGFSLVTSAPRWSSAALVAALGALRDTTASFGLIQIVGPFASAGELAAAHQALIDMRRKVKYRRAIGHFRARNPGETATAYAAAYQALVSTVDADTIALTPSWYAPSAINPGAIYVRPYAFHAAPRTAKLRQDISASSREEFGSGTGQIRDSAGQVLARAVDDFNQELFTPLRAFAPRTWPDKRETQIFAGQGVTLAVDGADTANLRVSQVLDLAAETAYPALANRVGRGLLPAPDNTLDKNEQTRIEERIGEILSRALVGTGIAVGARFVLDPNQVVVGTPPIRVRGRVLVRIKGYIDEFSVEIAVDATPTS